jgi:hypothetical protein
VAGCCAVAAAQSTESFVVQLHENCDMTAWQLWVTCEHYHEIPRNPLIYHRKSLNFVMVCNGLQDLATLAQTTKSLDLRYDFRVGAGPFSGPRGRWFKSSRPDLT